MIIKEYKVLNIKTGKVIVMNDNSINALKKHNLWHGFDILEKPTNVEIPVVNKIVQNPIIVEIDETTIIDESIVDEQNVDLSETEKPKRKNKKA